MVVGEEDLRYFAYWPISPVKLVCSPALDWREYP